MNTERISLMEQRLDRATAALSALQTALDQYENVLNDIDTLNTYLGSPEWHNDRDDDAAGRMPQGLKRGVLSEDAIWNLLEHNRELKKELATIGQTDDTDGTFRPMRRFKQQMSNEECVALLEQAPRGILALLGARLPIQRQPPLLPLCSRGSQTRRHSTLQQGLLLRAQRRQEGTRQLVVSL